METTPIQEWKIDRVESYYYASGRNRLTYEEITYWYNPNTCDRKETKRTATVGDNKNSWYDLPDWAKPITTLKLTGLWDG